MKKLNETDQKLLLESVWDYSTDAMRITDSKGKVIFVNNAYCILTGFDKVSLIGKPFEIIWEKKGQAGLLKCYKEFISGGKLNERADRELTSKNGKQCYLDESHSLIEMSGEKYVLSIFQDITKRKQAEEAQKLFLTLIDQINDTIEVIDPDTGRFLYANEKAWSELGYTREEFLTLTVSDIDPTVDSSLFAERKDEIRSLGSVVTEGYHQRKDGTRFPVEINVRYVQLDRGYIITVVRDVTERRKAEEELRKSEEKYRDLIENMGEGIVITDEEEKFIFLNPAAEKIFDVGQGELEGECIGIFFSKEEFKEVKKRTNERRHGKSSSFEEEIILRDGSKKDIFVTASPWYKDKKFKGTFAVFRDITDRKLMEELLKTSEEKYRNLIETMPEGFYRSTAEGYFVDVNPALVNMLGYDSKEELMKVYIPDELYFSRDERIDGVNYNIDFIPDAEIYRLKKKDGSEIWVDDQARYIKDSSGKILYHEGIMRDITESLRARNAILEAKEKAEEANRLKTSFLANMSHEIRTPLNGILGFSEIIQDENDFKEVKKIAGIINESGKRLLNTLNQILDLSSLEAHTKAINCKLIDINSIIKETIILFSVAVQKKNLELSFKSDDYPLMANTEPNFIINALNNLVNNAIKYTQRGSVIIKANEEIINKKECIVINVIDTGIGIEKKNLEIIFDEFRQVSEGLSRRFDGTGLGLSLCKKYMNLLGGSISVTSKPGEGSDFRLVIPKNNLKGDESIISKEERTVETSQQDSAQIKSEIKTKILYVEDDIVSIQLVKYILANQYDVDIATNGAEGIEKTKNNKYALILLDINFRKGISGLEVLSEIRKLQYYKDIPVIALTAFAMQEDEKEFWAVGFTDYISKPFEKETLLKKISKALKE